MRRGVVLVVELGVVEPTAEQRHRVVAAGAEPRRVHVAVPLQRRCPGVAHREQVGGIVERREAMRAVLPLRMGVRMAARAFRIAHQVMGRDVTSAGCARQRGFERHLGLRLHGPKFHEHDRGAANRDADESDGDADRPADALAGQAMQDEQPDDQDRRGDVRPVGKRACGGVAQFDQRDTPCQAEPGRKEDDDAGEQNQSEAHRELVGSTDGAAQVHDAVDQHGHRDGEAEHQVAEEHREIHRILEACARLPLPESDRAEVDRVHHQQREQAEHHEQQLAHAPTDHGQWSRAGRRISHV